MHREYERFRSPRARSLRDIVAYAVSLPQHSERIHFRRIQRFEVSTHFVGVVAVVAVVEGEQGVG
jgi:hypothetical protein